MRATIDPKTIEDFLLTQENVEDASVWIQGKIVHAHVTPAVGSHLSALSLREVCAAAIGTDQTPDDIILISTNAKN
jgi:hypothetical protein